MRKDKIIIHIVLFVFTIGIGNIIYYFSTHNRSKEQYYDDKPKIFMYVGIFWIFISCTTLIDSGYKEALNSLIIAIAFIVISIILKKNTYKKNKKQISDIYKLKNDKEILEKEVNSLVIERRNITKEISDINNYKQKILLEAESKYIDKNSIEYINTLDGLQFEEYTCNLLKKLNFNNVTKTKASGDFGIDVLAEKDGIKYAIQCKNYNSPLGSKCVQEAYSGKQYYNCHVGVVLTNSTFTQHAKDLANKNGILLWDKNKLIKMLE